VLGSAEVLRRYYREPAELVACKKIDVIDDGCRRVIAASPFVLVATADAAGRCTVSPRGGEPGFVRVLDEHRLALPDHTGNNLLDSLSNVIENPFVGLLFILPGRNETLRVEGRAWITIDPELRTELAGGGKVPKAAIGVEVEQAFVHCPRSFDKGSVWDVTTWGAVEAPEAMELFAGHLRRNLPPDRVPAELREG
jgi:PPOX class probable FMN-dependent enzyme